ncbi:cell surface protein [Aquimarina sp. AU58]|uniref:cell surface protein n=1 Tax=Aquimarina sp. AU58 TaxID=1874112 RepID=UPI000D6E931C|nr:cell surface protein [Aquimarina sp. AU58]
MKLINIIYVMVMVCIVVSCQKSKNIITSPQDYEAYIQKKENPKAQQAIKELQFWNNRITEDSTQILAMSRAAGVCSQLFQYTADIQQLKKAEQLLLKSVAVAAIKKEGYLLALAQNFISQHRFNEAKKAAQGAFILNPNRASRLVLFDVTMELGEYDDAKKHLESVANTSDYNFLIRLAKWNDYKGNLDATIRYMEKAKSIAESSKNQNLILWSYTNIADYYGHAGRIKDSYNHYLKALEIDPSNGYAKKGIAWIAYSYEQNPEEALRIMDAVIETHQSPDYYLLKAEIAEFQNNKKNKHQNIAAYQEAVDDHRYGDMYNAYNALLLAEEHQEFDKALQIAEREIANRPTPETYDLKAYILTLKGDYKQALEIAQEHIIDKTFEPEANYHIAEIYKANGLLDKVKSIKEELLESSYELGPVLSKSIKEL